MCLEEMLGSDEEQQHLRRAMEKVGWFADSDSELQYDLKKVLREEDYYLPPAQAARAASERQVGVMLDRSMRAEATRTLNKTQLGEQWMARIKSPRVDYDTPIAAKASELESLMKDISNAEEELEVAHNILQHNEEWHEEYARQLMEVKDTMAERQNAASHGS
eukprot:jgi/Tetstr1/434075/TSEL_023219.t1